MHRYQKSFAVAIFMLVFTTWFLHNTKSDFNLIFQKDLLAHDESSNSVVAANITRKFFPPMVRINPLDPQQKIWMEGPFWQHIPPLFAYVPYIFFKIDGQVTIEVKRLSYAFVTLLTGLLFIFSIYKFRKSLYAAAAATIAAIFWIHTSFTHELITGYAFGVSDIVLAFTVVCGLAGVLWYLEKESVERKKYSYTKLALIGLLVALPIMAKNLLGAIPAATFFIILIKDHKQINKKLLTPVGSFLALLLAYYLPLYFASPVTFKNEILISFLHVQNYEGWGRAWHWYFTNYLPIRYLGAWTTWFYLALIIAVATMIKLKGERKDKILLWLTGGWFFWNAIAVSLIKSKIPNFIYQSYLLVLFFVIYSLTLLLRKISIKHYFREYYPKIIAIILVISILVTGYEVMRFARQFHVQRAQAYNYQTEHEKFYQLAENLRDRGVSAKDLIIINNPPDDCWERYYFLFVTGAESKTLLEMSFLSIPYDRIEAQYRDIYFVDASGSVNKLDINTLDSILNSNKIQIQNEIERIKKDKTSCQWLVPDPILNAP